MLLGVAIFQFQCRSERMVDRCTAGIAKCFGADACDPVTDPVCGCWDDCTSAAFSSGMYGGSCCCLDESWWLQCCYCGHSRSTFRCSTLPCCHGSAGRGAESEAELRETDTLPMQSNVMINPCKRCELYHGSPATGGYCSKCFSNVMINPCSELHQVCTLPRPAACLEHDLACALPTSGALTWCSGT